MGYKPAIKSMGKIWKWIKKNVRPAAKLLDGGDPIDVQNDGVSKSIKKAKDRLVVGFKIRF